MVTFLQDQWSQLEDCDHTTYLQQMSFWHYFKNGFFQAFLTPLHLSSAKTASMMHICFNPQFKYVL